MRFLLVLVLGVVLGACIMFIVFAAPGVWFEYSASPITTTAGRQLLSQGWQVDRIYGTENAFAVLRRPRIDLPYEVLLHALFFSMGVAATAITAMWIARGKEHTRRDEPTRSQSDVVPEPVNI